MDESLLAMEHSVARESENSRHDGKISIARRRREGERKR